MSRNRLQRKVCMRRQATLKPQKPSARLSLRLQRHPIHRGRLLGEVVDVAAVHA